MIILGIETSCDETAAAVARGHGESVEIISNIVSSQVDIHRKYGGVVPEVAAREHVLNILPVIHEALNKAGVRGPSHKIAAAGKNPQSAIRNPQSAIDAIAVTIGPGLITSLQVGIETAKTLAFVWNLPLIAVNHIEAHIYANFIGANLKSEIRNSKQIQNSKFKFQNSLEFPAVILAVSGGHTMLVLMRSQAKFETIGDTRDDAAGEAFDKAASMLGLGYPGGPAIAKSASKYSDSHPEISNFQFAPAKSPERDFAAINKRGGKVLGGETLPEQKFQNPKSKIQNAIVLPRPMIKDKNFDFSFSGLKTALKYELAKDKNWQKRIPEYAAEFQQAVIDVLIHKTIKAAEKYQAKTVMLSGGVAANLELREQLIKAATSKIPQSEIRIPQLTYTTDNAAMVAAAGYFKARAKKFTPWQKLKVNCNAKL